jgi:hypothetical protein
MKDLIIGGASNYDWSVLKYWINSVNKSGFQGDKVLILMNCDKDTAKKVNDAGFKIIAFQQDEQGNLTYPNTGRAPHVERFLHIYNYLYSNEYRYVITTDVKDVVFQRNPIDYIEKNLTEDKNLLLSSESMLYKDEPWGNQNLLETYGDMIHDRFKNNEIYNVGVVAGRGHAMRDLILSIFVATQGRPIPICDQSAFNFMISMSPYKETSLYLKSENAWACQLGTTADPSRIEQFRPLLLEPEPKMVNGEVTTSEGNPYTIVHQYDRVPFWRETIEVKYGQ